MQQAATKAAYNLLHTGSLALCRLEENGIRINEDYLNQTIEKVSSEIDKLQEEFKKDRIYLLWKRRFGQKMKWEAVAQIKDVLVHDLGFSEDKFVDRKTGKDTAAEETLGKIKYPALEHYLGMRKLTKTRSTFLYGIQRELVDGYIHPFFHLAGGGFGDDKGGGARSYRGSASDPNSNNWPKRNKKIKDLMAPLFVPRGKKRRLVFRDYGSIEVKIATCYHKDPMMLKYINDPTTDMHRDMAMECYLLKRKQVSEMSRYSAKNKFVFPAFYGSYHKQIAPNLWEALDSLKLKVEGSQIEKGDGVSVKQHLKSKGIRRLGRCKHGEDPEKGTFEYHIREVERNFWNERFPVYRQWKEDWYNKYLDKGGFATLTGFYIEGYYVRNDTINYPVQGSAFHCLLWSIIEILKEIKKRQLDAFLINEVHDQLWGDVHEDSLQEYLDLTEEIMCHRVRKHWPWIITPLTVDAEVTELGKGMQTSRKWFKKDGLWQPKAA